MSEQEIIRRNSLQKIREAGIDPYPAEQYHVNITTEKIKKNFAGAEGEMQDVCIAGRIMSRRIMGESLFC